MKKILYVLILILFIPLSVNALEIKDLGFKSKDLNNTTFTQREEAEDTYTYYLNSLYAAGDNESYSVYIRAIQNPLDKSYTKDANLMDDVFGLVGKVNTNQYSFVISNNYKWIKFDYKTKDTDIPLKDYFLAWNNIYLTVTFQSKNGAFTDEENQEIDKFIQSIELTGKGQAAGVHILPNNVDTKPKVQINIIPFTLIASVIAIAITLFVTRKKK